MPLRRGALAGLLATVGMDLAARAIVAPALRITPPGPEYLGRWVGHMREGQFAHDDIATAAPVRHEVALGVATHYAIGLTLGAGYALLPHRGEARRSLALAVVCGTATTAFPWFLVFPALGQGLLGCRGRRRLAAFSLCNHVVFGLGLGAATSWLAQRDRATNPRPEAISSSSGSRIRAVAVSAIPTRAETRW